jgi:hypothetical protein
MSRGHFNISPPDASDSARSASLGALLSTVAFLIAVIDTVRAARCTGRAPVGTSQTEV